MNNIYKNDKVVLVKPFEKMQVVGDVYEVANITDTHVVLRNEKTKIAVGAISISDFEEYFESYSDRKENSKWTSWTSIVNETNNTIAFYRTNFKKTQVRINNGEKCIKGESCCTPTDEFDLFTGVRIAYARALIKALEIDVDNKYCEILEIVDKINDASSLIDKLTDSTSQKEENA